MSENCRFRQTTAPANFIGGDNYIDCTKSGHYIVPRILNLVVRSHYPWSTEATATITPNGDASSVVLETRPLYEDKKVELWLPLKDNDATENDYVRYVIDMNWGNVIDQDKLNPNLITVDLGERELQSGELVVAWDATTKPANFSTLKSSLRLS